MKHILGIDTSNYTTSVAYLTEDGEVLGDVRKFLTVAEGQRGLRQQEALFQHVQNLPELMTELTEQTGPIEPDAIGVSDRPRAQEGSYMPCFLPGLSLGQSLGAAYDAPVYTCSHQDGHVAAARDSLGLPVVSEEAVTAFHLSGGTCELVAVSCHYDDENNFTGYQSEILKYTKDISYGQVLDRIGVTMGYPFPCGRYLDELAQTGNAPGHLTPAKILPEGIHLSGLESQVQRFWQEGRYDTRNDLAADLFRAIADSIIKMCQGCDRVILMGGVSESDTLRRLLPADTFLYPAKDRGRDNAIGCALLATARI